MDRNSKDSKQPKAEDSGGDIMPIEPITHDQSWILSKVAVVLGPLTKKQSCNQLVRLGQSLILRQHIAVTWLAPFLASCFAIAFSTVWWNLNYLWRHEIPITAHYLLFLLRNFHTWYLFFSTLPYLAIVNILPWTKKTSTWRLFLYSLIALGVELIYYTLVLCHQYKPGLPLDYWFDVMFSVVLIPVLPAMIVRIFLLSLVRINRTESVGEIMDATTQTIGQGNSKISGNDSA